MTGRHGAVLEACIAAGQFCLAKQGNGLPFPEYPASKTITEVWGFNLGLSNLLLGAPNDSSSVRGFPASLGESHDAGLMDDDLDGLRCRRRAFPTIG